VKGKEGRYKSRGGELHFDAAVPEPFTQAAPPAI
jgi:hypothetical protein